MVLSGGEGATLIEHADNGFRQHPDTAAAGSVRNSTNSSERFCIFAASFMWPDFSARASSGSNTTPTATPTTPSRQLVDSIRVLKGCDRAFLGGSNRLTDDLVDLGNATGNSSRNSQHQQAA